MQNKFASESVTNHTVTASLNACTWVYKESERGRESVKARQLKEVGERNEK